MKLGVCHMWGDNLQQFRDELRLSNELGFDIVGIGDSPAGWRDLYVSMTVAALETDKAIIAPFVTSPFLRHPLVVANAMSALQELSGGRMALGLATGGSNIMAVGHPPATQKEIRAYWDSLSDLMDGKSTQWEGAPTAALLHARRTPIYYSAFGPKALKLAGERGDGVIMFGSMNLEDTARKISAVREGAEQAGRDPDAVDIWVTGFCSIRPTREQAIDDLKAFIVVNGMAIRTPQTLAMVPEQLKPALFELQKRYDPSEHVAVGGRNVALLNELGPELTEFLAGHDTIVGTEQEVKAVMDGLRDLGVGAFITNMPGHADREGNMRALAAMLK
jgi:5,10-methylenetetrahydromethanopterin reductase